jgi:hypothetical protein
VYVLVSPDASFNPNLLQSDDILQLNHYNSVVTLGLPVIMPESGWF